MRYTDKELHQIRRAFVDRYCGESDDVAEFWGSFESFDLLPSVNSWLFVSMPVATLDEHNGFVAFMRDNGFSLVEWNDEEGVNVHAFAFRRLKWI